MIRPFIVGFSTTFKHIFKKPITVNYPDAEDPGVPEVPRQAGADAGRERPREVRRLRPVLGRVPGRRDLPRGGGERRHASRPARATRRSTRSTRRAASSAAVRGGLPGVGDLHGQGLRARRLQQQGLHLGQGRPARPGAMPRRRHRPQATHDCSARSATSTATSRQRRAASWNGTPRCRSGFVWATSPTPTAATKPFAAPLYWIKGNNENFDAIAVRRSARPRPALHPERQTLRDDRGPARRRARRHVRADVVRDARRRTLPHPKKGTAKATELADRRRHFVREEVEACKRLRGRRRLPDPRGAAAVSRRPGRGIDAGKTQINEVLAAMKPRLHLFGHHHRFAERSGRACRRSASIWCRRRTC